VARTRACLAAGGGFAPSHLARGLVALGDHGLGWLARQRVLRIGGAQPAVVIEDLDRAQVVRHVADLDGFAAARGDLRRDEGHAVEMDAVFVDHPGAVGRQHPSQLVGLDQLQRCC
jgi:hypothetical protein